MKELALIFLCLCCFSIGAEPNFLEPIVVQMPEQFSQIPLKCQQAYEQAIADKTGYEHSKGMNCLPMDHGAMETLSKDFIAICIDDATREVTKVAKGRAEYSVGQIKMIFDIHYGQLFRTQCMDREIAKFQRQPQPPANEAPVRASAYSPRIHEAYDSAGGAAYR